MNNDIQIFNSEEFGDIRTVTVNNEPWFVGKDVAEALGYAKPLNALSTHVEKDDSLKQGLTDSLGREQETIFINESGLYALIFGSKLESAKRFKLGLLPMYSQRSGKQVVTRWHSHGEKSCLRWRC